jgi:hypothetical protein
MSVVNLQKQMLTFPQPPELVDFKFGGVTIEVTKDGNVTIKGAKKLSIEADDFSVEAERIKFHAKESLDVDVDGDIYMGSSTHMIMQAPRLDHNPHEGRKTGYKVANTIKKLIRTFENYYPSWRDPEGVYVEKPRAAVPQCKCGKCDASES